MENCYFSKAYTNAIKGVAIILMVTLHLLQERWMPDSNTIIDFRIGEVPFASIIAYACDICIGIFAFISGYGWAASFESKSLLERIKPIYQTYWLVLLLFAFPARILNAYINSEKLVIGLQEVVLSVLGIRSLSVVFQWYVFFFAIAVLTFKPLWKLIKNVQIRIKYKIILLIAISIIPRFILSIIYRYITISVVLKDEISHYISWMPVILIGALIKENMIFDRIDKLIDGRVNTITKRIGCMFFLVGCIVGKALFQHFSGIKTNLDALLILPFMYCLIYAVKQIIATKTGKVLDYLGVLSLYLWLMHRVFLYNPVRSWTLHLRLPIMIVIVPIVVLVPVAILLKLIDSKISSVLQKG